jgi:hypothetical protein
MDIASCLLVYILYFVDWEAVGLLLLFFVHNFAFKIFFFLLFCMQVLGALPDRDSAGG